MRTWGQATLWGVAWVIIGCAGGETPSDEPEPEPGPGGFDFGLPDGGDKPDPPLPPAECMPGDSQECRLSPTCSGIQICTEGRFGPCDVPPERCNGLDDDCDEKTDEGFVGLGMACAVGVGSCQATGVNICDPSGRGVACDASPGVEQPEACNGFDDDCDGITDEGDAGPLCPETEANCADRIDDDGDGRVDCEDEDCAGGPDCGEPVELCGEPGDEDGDGATDCEDPDCEGHPACAPPPVEICDQQGDEDRDGAADCDDPDCEGFVDCLPPPEEICNQPGDEDGDGQFDCLDPDCEGHPACAPPPPEDCALRGDEDGDGLFDCLDPDCADAPNCQAPTELCEQDGDEDGDNLADCLDPDCAEHPRCVVEVCDEVGDEDGNGLADCADPACADDPACRPEVCDAEGDEDGDGLADCADPDCVDAPACQPEELCDQPGDEDGDGLTNCDDPDCIGDPACAVEPGEILPIVEPRQLIELEGSIDANDPTWARPDEMCAPTPAEAAHYDLYRVRNDSGAPRLLRVEALWDGDGFIHVTTGDFDPANPQCRAANDDDTGIGDSRIPLVWIADGEVLNVVATTFDTQDPIGDYVMQITVSETLAVPIAAPGGNEVFEGSIDGDESQWARPVVCGAPDNEADHFYETALLYNPGAEPQTLTIDAQWDGDGYLHAFSYATPFWDPVDNMQCVDGNDDFGGIGGSRMSNVEIPAGAALMMVASTFSGGVMIGPYTITVTTNPP